MKIGILTFNNSNNYGAVLQTFALLTYLKKLGFAPEIIDYKHVIKRGSPILRILDNALNRVTASHYTAFKNFRENFLTSKSKLVHKAEELKEVAKSYEAIIVGSDQVWRWKYVKDFGYTYFLDFATEESIKISYAASFGIDSFEGDSEVTNVIRKLLKRFSAISVREESGVEICKKTFDVDACELIDPTLLLEPQNYLLIVNKKLKEGYSDHIAQYILDKDITKENILFSISNYMNAPIKNIYKKNHRFYTLKYQRLPFSQFKFPKVDYWLENLYLSKFVITDSFHGIAFSILFNKQFVCIGNRERGLTRITNILKKFGLEDRLVSSPEKAILLVDQMIEYEEINNILQKERLRSKNFLAGVLTIK